MVLVKEGNLLKIKWVCPVCSSTNICEKTEHMQCFVCGKYYEEGSHLSEMYDVEPADIVVTKHGFKEKLMSFMEKVKFVFGITASDASKRKIADWKIEHSPLESKEAYIKAIPIYDEISDRTLSVAIPEDSESEMKFTGSIEEGERSHEHVIPSELSEDIEPWAEHKSAFDFSRIRFTGCVDVIKVNVHGNKCYKLLYRNGSEKILTLANMKIMGYLVDSSTDTYSEPHSVDVCSFIPWSEHRIEFDTEKLSATGCVNVEQTEISGNKYYKLTYRDGAERILNISSLKMMGYAREI